MSDIDLPATGKDTSLTVMYDGATIGVYDVEGWSVEPVYESTTTLPLGTTQRRIDQIETGWKGSFEVAVSSKESDELLDVIHAAGEARIPGVLILSETTKYRDLTSKSYVYSDCKIMGAPKEVKRGQKTSLRVSWETGMHRVAR